MSDNFTRRADGEAVIVKDNKMLLSFSIGMGMLLVASLTIAAGIFSFALRKQSRTRKLSQRINELTTSRQRRVSHKKQPE